MSMKTPSNQFELIQRIEIKTSSQHTWYVICNNHKNVVTWRNFSMNKNLQNMTNITNRHIYMINKKVRVLFTIAHVTYHDFSTLSK